ncbi:MAG: DUF1206 domain-containing protein [Thermoanaerobaculia bacterium]
MRSAPERAGYFAIGLIYVAMGYVSARIAVLGARDPDHGVLGALRFLLDRPLGAWVLGAVVAGLAAIAGAHLVQSIRGPGGVVKRIGLFVNGFSYAVLAVTATRLLLHLRVRPAAGGASLERQGVSWLLSESWGAAALELAGVAVALGGFWEIGQGLAGRLPFRGGRLPRKLVNLFAAISRFGLVARGATLATLGYFLIRAAEELDPAAVRNVGGVLEAFAHTPLGPAFMAAAAAGLAAYGIYVAGIALAG